VKVDVKHWRLETGEQEHVGKSIVYPTGFRAGPPRGYYCWVYTDDTNGFCDWMQQHCPTADCTPRFNSGDPMVTVYISSEEEAVIFKLRW
jgi:hypothetical protein